MGDKGKCTFGTRMPIDIHMLNEIIYREVKHFRNYKTYRPNFGCVPVASKFYASHDHLTSESQEQTQKVDNYFDNVTQTRAKGPHSKYPSPATENQWYTSIISITLFSSSPIIAKPRSYGWYFEPLYPTDHNDRRFYHPQQESQHTKIEVIIRILIRLIVTNAFTGYDMFPGFTKINSSHKNSEKYNITKKNTTTLNKTNIEHVNTTFIINEDNKNLTVELNDTEQFINKMLGNKNETLVLTELGCKEEEPPVNIGAYEVPTERDIIILYRETLVHRLNVYHKEILDFLRDVKDVTKASINYESRCVNKTLFRKCIRKTSNQYIHAAKSQALAAEKERHLNEPFIKGQVCKITEIKNNPMELLKRLAIEKTVLDFALPAFLRLLHECFNFCNKS